ncbi:MAG: 16S rRNA (uracil(1498)-N(3))-methyltransferase, partial [Acidobacteria bacterium]|nr:16S rRNA (uracil(1498)-N(3))-methyltransferase [Acidobacteriota bacterium]
MLPRFFAPGLEPDSQTIALPADEARHLSRVLRLRSGDDVRVFDGRGHEYLAQVEATGGRQATVRLIEPIVPARESPISLTLAQAVLAGDKMDAVVRDLTMLGVAVIQPVVSARSETSLALLARSHRTERWRRVAVASAKQCGRAIVPLISEPIALQDWLRGDTSGVRLILAEPEGDSPVGGSRPLDAVSHLTHGTVTLLVGPEGGWTAAEATMAQTAGFVPWTLGGRTLRAETAALIAVT